MMKIECSINPCLTKRHNKHLFSKKIEKNFQQIIIGIQPRMPTITQEEKKKSQEFVNALNSLLEMVEDISTYIPEGKYLEMMNQLKEVNDTAENPIVNIIDVLNNTEVVRENRRRAEMRVRMLKKQAKKSICPLCDTPVIHVHKHQQNNKCKLIRRTKILSAYSGKINTNNMEKMINEIEVFDEKMYYRYLLRDWKNNMN